MRYHYINTIQQFYTITYDDNIQSEKKFIYTLSTVWFLIEKEVKNFMKYVVSHLVCK